MPTAPYTVFVEIDASRAYEALGALEAAGAVALELADHRSAPRVYAALDGASEGEVSARVGAALAAAGLRDCPRGVTATTLLDWGSTWSARLRPIEVGPLRIAVDEPDLGGGPRPSAGDAPGLSIVTGGAFGSGVHPTTALVLERLEFLAPVDCVLDVGTGTGILALAALRLGCAEAVGTDTDAVALRSAQANAERNGLAARLRLSSAAPDRLGRAFPLVLANILAAPLCELAPSLTRALGPSARLVLSGLRESDAAEVGRAYRWQGLRPSGEEQRGEWVRLEFTPPW